MVSLEESDYQNSKQNKEMRKNQPNSREKKEFKTVASSQNQLKPLKPVSNLPQQKSLLQKKPEPLPTFNLLKKYFKRSLTLYTIAELKSSHSKILEELAELRDSFLNEYREYLDMMKGNVRLEKEELDQFEEQSSQVEGYIQATGMVLDNEREMTIMVREHLSHLRKFMAEERVFSRRFLQEDESFLRELPKAQTNKNFYPPSGPQVQAKKKGKVESEDSLLLDED